MYSLQKLIEATEGLCEVQFTKTGINTKFLCHIIVKKFL
jgi:hypothetical protein